jgi:Malectin domain
MKRFILSARLWLFPILCCGAGAQITISPSNPIVRQGGTVRFTSSAPATWGVAPGSPGSIDADGTYHAPVHLAAKQVAGGCQVLPNDHIYNTRIDDLPGDSHSAEWIARAPNYVGIPSLGDFGINLFSNADLQTPQHFLYTPRSNGPFFMPPPDKLRIEHGSHTFQTVSVDRHMISINHQTCRTQEIYAPYPAGMNVACPACTAQSGIEWNMLDYALPRAGTDAAGLQLLPLTYRRDEIVSGNIRHAGRFTLAAGYIAGGEVRWPAQATTGGGPAGKSMPMGSRVRLKSSFRIDSLRSPYARNLAKAFAEYGLILADIGGSWQVQTENSVYDPTLAAAFIEIQQAMHNTDFEVVDESALMVSPDSGMINAGKGVDSPESVIVIATGSRGRQASTRVILQAATAGVETQWLAIQAGSAPVRLNAWVNGTANDSLSWTMKPALGSVSLSGVFTAPASVTGLQTATIQVSSRADPAVTASIGVSVLPRGSIHINSGSISDYTDTHGSVWYADMAPGRPYLGLDQGRLYEYSYGFSWRNTATPKLFNDWLVGYDDVYRLIVPNGHYKVTFKLAEIHETKINARCVDLEAQGQVVYQGWDTLARAGAPDTAIDVEVPATVTDGTLSFAIRDLGCSPAPVSFWTLPGYRQGFGPGLAAVQIDPVTPAPHISIDIPPSGVTMGQKLSLHAIRWYAAGDIRWSLVSGPGTIDATGLYTAPATPQNAAAIIRAQSTADPSLTATVSLPISFGEVSVDPPNAELAHSLTRLMTARIGRVSYANVIWTASAGSITAGGLYTAPPSVTADTPVTITATSRDDPAKSATATLTIKAIAPPIRVNFGDLGDLRDAGGNVWARDPGPSGGDPTTAYNHPNPIANVPLDMQPLYQSASYRYGGGRFWYVFKVPNGTYRVTLKFADYSRNKAGDYKQSVLLNGRKVLSDFDLLTAAGGPLRVIDKTFTVMVKDSALRLELVSEDEKIAQINGIEIQDLGPEGK